MIRKLFFAICAGVAGIFGFGMILALVHPFLSGVSSRDYELVRTIGSIVATIVGVGILEWSSKSRRAEANSSIENQAPTETHPSVSSCGAVRVRGAIVLLISLVVGTVGVAGIYFEVANDLAGILIVVSAIAALFGLLSLAGGKGLTV